LKTNVIIQKLEIEECTTSLLDSFNRYQEVTHCWRKENREWELQNISFTEQWDKPKKIEVIKEFTKCIENGGIVTVALIENDIIGFSAILNNLFGKNINYIQLEQLHISVDFRNKGVGKKLFKEACTNAKRLNADKLYVSAQSSKETQAFYKAMGCYETLEINQQLFEDEPFDCHLEYLL